MQSAIGSQESHSASGVVMVIFILFDGMGLVAKRLEYIPNNDLPKFRVISDNTFYSPYERTADEINIVGRIRWFAREL